MKKIYCSYEIYGKKMYKQFESKSDLEEQYNHFIEYRGYIENEPKYLSIEYMLSEMRLKRISYNEYIKKSK